MGNHKEVSNLANVPNGPNMPNKDPRRLLIRINSCAFAVYFFNGSKIAPWRKSPIISARPRRYSTPT